MARYRHKITGFVRDYADDYARHVSALERVEDDTVLSEPDCGCGPASFEEDELDDIFFHVGEIKE